VLIVSSALLTTPRVAADVSGNVAPFDKGDCKHDGWRTLVDDHDSPFKNQGDCVSWTLHHPHIVDLDDLVGSFDGTSVFNFNESGCSFVHQAFEGAYAGSSVVGAVGLRIDGCLDRSPAGVDYPMTGTFTMSTSAGTLAGTVTGFETVNTVPVPVHLVLSPTSGTGAFSGQTGTITVNGLWFTSVSPRTPEPFSGTVSVP
jgi:hypothetical protein